MKQGKACRDRKGNNGRKVILWKGQWSQLFYPQAGFFFFFFLTKYTEYPGEENVMSVSARQWKERQTGTCKIEFARKRWKEMQTVNV